jgi:hypothetical protein
MNDPGAEGAGRRRQSRGLLTYQLVLKKIKKINEVYAWDIKNVFRQRSASIGDESMNRTKRKGSKCEKAKGSHTGL